MDALILSCGTGGGHNAAAKAIMEELIGRGWNAEGAFIAYPHSL